MRLPSIRPDQLTPQQKALYDRNRKQIAQSFTSFKTVREDGALLGPWGIFLHEPSVGQAHYDQIAAVSDLKQLPQAAKQIAILVTGARYKAAYELYAHAAVAESAGMAVEKIATICAGERPADLTDEEAAAFDVSSALVGGSVLPGSCYQRALEIFGQAAVIELVLWVSLYAQVSIVLNAFDVPSEQDFSAKQAIT